MKFRMAHTNLNVLDIDRTVAFYRAALGLEEKRRHAAPDGSFKIAFLGNGETDYMLELTWLRDKKEPYNLGDNETHIAFAAEDMAEAHTLHEKMGCICFENKAMGLYFIEDPDGYWLEIIPSRR
jgi:lactoylglutathione lyase